MAGGLDRGAVAWGEVSDGHGATEKDSGMGSRNFVRRVPVLCRRSPWMAGTASDAAVAGDSTGQVADRSAARAEPDRFRRRLLLVATVPRKGGRARAISDAG